MSRIETIGDATLYLGDCREILPTLGKVDAVVTDIPYEASQESNGLRQLDYGEWDGMGASDLAISVLRSMDPVPTVVAFCHWNQLNDIAKLYPDRSWRPIVWVKSNPTVINGQHLFVPFGEFAYYGKNPGAWFGGNCIRSVWHGAAPQKRDHPTQKPLELMRWCIVNVVAPSGICLDPFMGSGTTGVAAIKLGRRFIGIEIEPRHFDIACRRLDDATRQPDMFVERPPAPKQESWTEGWEKPFDFSQEPKP
jgi:site-specific DNA-methyltransferase (adenine-specific)